MKKRNGKLKISLLLMIICTVILSSCASKPETYEIPVFDIMEEKFTTMEVEKQDIHDWDKIKLSLKTTSGTTFSFNYPEYEKCTLYVNEPGTTVKKGDVLGVITDKDLEYDLRLKQEDLELKELLYAELYNKYLATNEGYYDMQLALLDVEQAQYNYNKAVEKMDTLKFKSPIDGIVEKVVETYKQMNDSYNNPYKVYTVTYTYVIENYLLDISVADAGSEAFQKLGLKPDDTYQIYDSSNNTYNVRITRIYTSSSYNSFLRRTVRNTVITVEFIKEEGVDYANVVKYALYYNLTLKQLNNVIVIPKNLVVKTSSGEYYTYVLENNKKTIRYLTLGTEVLNSTSYVVLSGLSENDLIITGSVME